MATELYSLNSTGRPLVDESFLSEARELTHEELRPYIDPVHRSVDLTAVDEKIQEIKDDEEIEKYSSDIDPKLAPTLHRELDISPRLAADAGFWHYLCIVRFPEFVRYRWKYKEEKPENLEEKFLGAGTDIYSNALHRLWWIAELTYESADSGDPTDREYERTQKALGFQELANDVFDRWFARYRPLSVNCVDLLCPEALNAVKEEGSYDDPPSNSSIVRDTTTRLHEELTIRRVEGMTDSEIEATIKSLRDEIMRSG